MAGGVVIDLSPDGTQVATDIQQQTNGDIWLVDVETGAPKRFTSNDGFDYTPVWSPDGSRIAYTVPVDGAVRIYVQEVEGETPPVELYRTQADTDLWTYSWSPDDWIAFVEPVGGDRNIHAVQVGGPDRRVDIAVTSAYEEVPSFSPCLV